MDNDDKSGAYVKPPSGSYVLWENTMCNPLGDMRTQTQNAWHDGYASAKVEREWVGLTANELSMIGDHMRTWNSHSLTDIYVAIEAKLKEKNG